MPRLLIFLLIVAICGALDIALHMVGGDLMPMPSVFSPLVNQFGFSTLAAAWIALAFTGMGLAFLFWARHMVGSGWPKGVRYGLALGLMILIAMFEGVGLLGTPLIGELVMGLADAIPIALMIALLGWKLAPDSPNVDACGRLPGLLVLVVFALVFGFGRAGIQYLGLIESGLTERALPSLFWPFAMGAATGVLFLAVTDALRDLSRVSAALAFGLGVFGVNWALFMSFVPMVFPDAWADTALRVGLDILIVTCAALLVARLRPQAAG